MEPGWMTQSTVTPQAWWPEAAAEWEAGDRALLAGLDPSRLPEHLAIIMDGNGRWARGRGFMDRVRGHEAGTEAVRAAVRTCAEMRLKVLTLYAFSKENWRRPQTEIAALMTLLGRFLRAERGLLMEHKIRLTTIGCLEDLPADVRGELEETIAMSAGHRGLTLNLALSYGGRDEIVRAARKAARLAAEGRLDPEALDEGQFANLLDTAGLPEPDLLIRTSGEQRISNFLLWQIAYSEIHVSPVLWPDFRRTQILEAFADYQRRERRYGGVLESPARQG